MKKIGRFLMAVFMVLVSVGTASAEMTMPTLATTNIEAAGTAVAAVIGTYVLIKLAIRVFKGM